MPSKRIIAAIVGAALLMGAVVSGCNRNRDVAAAKPRRQDKTTPSLNSDLAQASIARPAEVLAASVRRQNRPARAARQRARSALYQEYYLSPQSAAELARYEPLPEPVPLSELHARQSAYPPAVIHPSPELAMARAALTPMTIPAPQPSLQAAAAVRMPGEFVVPPIDPGLFVAPIPELDPVRYQPPAAQTRQPQRGRIPLLTANPVPARSQSQQRALEPLRQPQQQTRQQPSPATKTWTQGWVPSPATAMGGE